MAHKKIPLQIEDFVMSSTLSAHLPSLKIIAKQQNLRLNRKIDFDKAVKILIESIKYN